MEATLTKKAAQPTALKQGFRQVNSSSMFILEQGANHSSSMAILEKANLVPYERKEILLLLMNDAGLKEELKGKWFYIAGKGLEKNGLFTIKAMEELVERKGKVSIENNVRVWNGPHPLSLGVVSDHLAAGYGWRFILDADDEPHVAAPVVVGKAKSSEAAAPKSDSIVTSTYTSEELRALLRGAKAEIVALSLMKPGDFAQTTKLINGIEIKE